MNLVTSNVGLGEPMNGGVLSANAQESENSVIRQYWRIAVRWRWVILGIIAACALIGLIITLLMTPQYTASAQIEISREANQVTSFQGVERDSSPVDQEFYQTQYGLLKSHSLTTRIATQLRLADDPHFFEMFNVGKNQEGEFAQANGRFTAAGRADRLRVAGELLEANVDISPVRLSRLVEISFSSPDPGFSARVVNAWADAFIQTNLERKIQATSYGRNLLQRQLGQAKVRLDESQRQLVNYATQQQIINLPSQGSSGTASSERSIVADDLAALNTALGQATADRIRAEARYTQANRVASSADSLRNTAISALRQRRAELAANYQRLMVQFEPEYPAARAVKAQIDQLDRSIGQEEGRVAGSQLTDYREAQERERGFKSRVDQLKSSYLDLRRRSIQYNIYQQEVDTNRALYDGLLQRFKEIGVAGGVGINNVSVVDLAIPPQKPSRPRLLLNLALAMIIGAGLGAVAAFALEQMDEAISDPAEIERQFGLPLLGSVPKVADGGEPENELMNPKSDIVDAYLAIQTNLSFTTKHGVPRSFAVTSTRPAEGKSTTALALAATLARAQRRVILIDGDMRSPSVHYLGGVDHDRGLSNFLSGEDDIASLTFVMRNLGFTAMSAGPIPPNAAELLTSDRLSVLLERLLEQFDHVVVDSPPVMGLADAPLIASRVEGVIFAIESHGIRGSLVKMALNRLASANAHILGGVLTKFEARKSNSGYEYGYGYGRAGKI